MKKEGRADAAARATLRAAFSDAFPIYALSPPYYGLPSTYIYDIFHFYIISYI